MYEPNDGAVTKVSLLSQQTSDPAIARHKYSYFPVDHPVFLSEKHSQLIGNIDFQQPAACTAERLLLNRHTCIQ